MSAGERRDITPWVSAICAFIALLVAWYTAWDTRRTRQLEIFDRAYRRIVDLEQKFLEASANGTTVPAALAWRTSFLNALECFSLLVNKQYLNDPALSGYLSEAVVHWYENIFLPAASSEELHNPKIYPELKKLFWLARPQECSFDQV